MSDSAKRYCIMPSCKGEKMDLVHKFPRNDERAREWLEIINLPEVSSIPLEQLRKSKFICTRHFAPEAYKNSESRSLNINAVPSRNLGRLETLEPIINRERRARHGFPVPTNEGTKLNYFNNFSFSHERAEERETKCHVILNEDKKDKIKKIEKPEVFEIEESEPETEKIVLVSNNKRVLSQNIVVLTPIKRKKLEKSPITKKEIFYEESEVQIENLPIQDEVTSSQIIEENEQIHVPEAPKLDFIEIEDETRFPGGIKLNYFWLRDHCRCEKCYDKDTSQRKMALTDIPLDIKPSKYEIQEESLRVKWPDDHESFYELNFLYNYQPSIRRPLYEESKSVLWTSENVSKLDVANVDLSDLLCNDSAVKSVLESLIKYGVAFVNKVPATQHSTEMTITRLFPLMKTFFGEMWTFSDTKDHHDFAYTNNYLPAHNDNTYFNDAAGLQILHCIQHQGEGGENFLVDGFQVVSQLEKDHFEAYNRLCNYQIPSEYIEEGRNHRHIGPLIKLNPLTGQPEQLRFNMNDRAVLDTIPFDKIQQFYTDFHLLSSYIQRKTHEWKFKLNPGTVLIFDNWRILHGRHSYTGKRVMTGSYVLRTEFLSAARVAGIIP
ncbi:trimethyllysine dioxygenase, mitochondrial-like [Culicoides brevitarsis]|uniref:trimethyllysine dioxygenase, mitochondrial-like n=1 Tax=Culicoides brevitarsis TaxID=469753 RepID=UPI00307C72BE